MAYKFNNPINRMKARSLLKNLLPHALEHARANPATAAMPPAAVEAADMKWYRTGRCAGVHVRKAESGGWLAELFFEGVPSNLPPVVGTPHASPCATRQEALDQAVAMLASFSSVPVGAGDVDLSDAVFLFDDLQISLPAAAFRAVREVSDQIPNKDDVISRLELLRFELNRGRPFTVADARRLSLPDQGRIQATCMLAVLGGLVRYPETGTGQPEPVPGPM